MRTMRKRDRWLRMFEISLRELPGLTQRAAQIADEFVSEYQERFGPLPDEHQREEVYTYRVKETGEKPEPGKFYKETEVDDGYVFGEGMK